jgi:hypothetical protein
MMNVSQSTMRLGASLLSAAFLASVTVVMAGCGPTGGNPGVVSGTVTYNGKPVTGGNLTLHPVKGGPDLPIPIDREGKFSSSGVPEGEMQVSIETESLKNKAAVPPDPPKDMKLPPGVKPEDIKKPDIDMSNRPTYMKIPRKYADAKTSGLTWTLTKGDNKKDFDLSD